MVKKGIITAIFICLFLIVFVSGTNSNLSVSEGAYECVKTKITSSCNLQTTPNLAMALNALAYNSTYQTSCKTNLLKNKKNEGTNLSCFSNTGGGACDIKSTAMGALALERLGEDITEYLDWLESKKIKSSNLNWLLEIDSNVATDCEIRSIGQNVNYILEENKQITGSASNCFTPVYSNYFLSISPSCYDSTFAISCSDDFWTTLIYQKNGDNTFYVSSNTNTALANEITEEEINSFCLGESACNYEGSLWGAIVLQKNGRDVSGLIPYLNAEKEENNQLIPASFLYYLTGNSEHLTELEIKFTGEHFNTGYWDLTGNKYLDSALIASFIDSPGTNEIESLKNYLTENVGGDGCWKQTDEVYETSFLLYALWPKSPTTIIDACVPNCSGKDCGGDGCGGICGTCGNGTSCVVNSCVNDTEECRDECSQKGQKKCLGSYLVSCGNYDEDSCLEYSSRANGTLCPNGCNLGQCKGNTSVGPKDCENQGNYCLTLSNCNKNDILGSRLFTCPGVKVCCKNDVVLLSCSDKGGEICEDGEVCKGSPVSAEDTNDCCVSGCKPEDIVQNDCFEVEGNCKTSCGDDEEESPYRSCGGDSIEICCVKKEGGTNWILIFLLLILIVLVVLAIIYRNQVKIWWFRIKNKFSKDKGPKSVNRPSGPPAPPKGRPSFMPRKIVPRNKLPRPPMRRPAPIKKPLPNNPKKNESFEDTMKKLKDMSK